MAIREAKIGKAKMLRKEMNMKMKKGGEMAGTGS